MSSSDPFWKSKVVRGAVIGLIGVLSMGAAGIVRQHGDDIAQLKTSDAVQAERDARILADLAAIKAKLGIP